ncbi:ammonium transporter [Tardisphaera miroshnichenkoae]
MLPNAASTAWVLISSALVMIMIPALALFYAGMVKEESLQAVTEQTVLALVIVSIEWVLVGFSLAFSTGSPFIGGLSWLALSGINSQDMLQGSGIPMLAYATFMGLFAAITPALIAGVFTTRVKTTALAAFILLWSILVYDPVAHWIWGTGGWLKSLGMLDFAGGAVVHLNAGMAALAFAAYVRKKGKAIHATEPGNGTYLVLGSLLLLFGWFGFNAGSALSADGLAALAFANTLLGASSAGLVWMLIGWYRRSHGISDAMQGMIAGLVAITPAAGFVTPAYAMVIGFVGGIVTSLSSGFRARKGLADPLDVWGVHGMGGAWGALATGLFATVGARGLIAGNLSAVAVQGLGVVAVAAYSFGVTYVVIALLDRWLGFELPQQAPISESSMESEVPAIFEAKIGKNATPHAQETREFP